MGGVGDHQLDLADGAFTSVPTERMSHVASQSSKFRDVGVTPVAHSDAAADRTDAQGMMAMIRLANSESQESGSNSFSSMGNSPMLT